MAPQPGLGWLFCPSTPVLPKSECSALLVPKILCRGREKESESEHARELGARELGARELGACTLGMSSAYPVQPLLKIELCFAERFSNDTTKCPLTHQSGDSKLIISSVRHNHMFIMENN